MIQRKWPFLVSRGVHKRQAPLPGLDIDITLEFVQGSFVAPNPWQRATGRQPGGTDPVCRVRFGVSPLADRIYVDGLWVAQSHRRMGYASALLLALVERFSPAETRLSITALHEVATSTAFWEALRNGRIEGLHVNLDLRGSSEMAEEAKRWRTHG